MTPVEILMELTAAHVKLVEVGQMLATLATRIGKMSAVEMTDDCETARCPRCGSTSITSTLDSRGIHLSCKDCYGDVGRD